MRPIDADALTTDVRAMYITRANHPEDLLQLGGATALMDVLEKIDAQPTVNEWISVKERLPEEDGEYLVVLGRLNDKWGPSVDLRWFAKDMRKCFSVSEKFKRRPGWYFHDGEWGDVEDTTVEFWMPKPDLPEVEG